MDSQILTTIITGAFSLVTGLASVWLKDHLERRRLSERDSKKPKEGRRSSRAFMVLLAGLVLGSASRALRGRGPVHYEAIVALGILIVIALFLAINHRKSSNGFWPFQLEIVSLWFAFAAGWSLVHGSIWGDIVSFTVAWWIGSALIGGIMVSWKKRAAE